MRNENNYTIITQMVVDKKHTPLEISHIIRKAMLEAKIDPYKISVMNKENYLAECQKEEEDPGVLVEFNEYFKTMTQNGSEIEFNTTEVKPKE